MRAICRMVVNVAGVYVAHALCAHHREAWVRLADGGRPYREYEAKPDEDCEYCASQAD